MSEHFPVRLFQQLLLSWYKKNGRDLPWRKLARSEQSAPKQLRDPYRILVSELMLQQTQVSRVVPKFEAFLAKWPTIAALARAPLSDVLIAWAGLGYNRRAKHLLETAKIIHHTYQGIFPREKKELLALPGFGPYMASALRVFALGEEDAVVDVNVERVLSRIENGPHFAKASLGARSEMQEVADQSVPKGEADSWHQALMDFGATICTAKAPLCAQCPVSRICQANKEAKNRGYAWYSDWLMTQPKVKKVSKKDAGKKFEETDRYFRGRVIDLLREGEQSMERVQNHICIEHRLADKKRFGTIIESLVIDGLVVVRANRAALA